MSRNDRRTGRVALSAALCLSLWAASAQRADAQAELSGTYIQYLGVGANGIMLNSANHSMSYAESGMAPFSCDIWFPGTPMHQFTVRATGPSGSQQATNSPTGTQIATVRPTATVGRNITWSGRVTLGGVPLRVDIVYSFADTLDRSVIETVRITNEDPTTDATDVYLLINGDPDHGQCSIGGSYASTNDVALQQPADGAAMVTAIAGNAPAVAFALGTTDATARAHVNTTGLPNTDPVTTWASPNDPNGTTRDVGISLAFRVRTLRAGTTRAFRMAYVWGPDQATVINRFNNLGCAVQLGGSACTDAGGAAGTCRAGACCTGCWDGAACQTGDTATSCGAAGARCASCDDGNACTDDVCGAGACSSSPTAAGAACDDGLFCTVADACDGAGACGGTARACDDGLSCTTDACDEAAGACTATVASGCAIGGACVADGDADPSNACQVCDPATSTTAYSPAAAGAACDDGLFCTVADACDGAGACGGTARACDDGLSCTTDACDEAAGACTATVASGCAIGGACVADGTLNPANDCEACVPGSSTSAYSYFASPTCDSDMDSVLDVDELPGDSDMDGMPDYLDPDDDGDGVPTLAEVPHGDTDMDGVADYLDPDDDQDGIPTLDERPGDVDRDTNDDGTPDYLDPDDDGDSIPTVDERPGGADQDTDSDSTPNHLDPDDDGDTIPTATEVTDGGTFGDDVDTDGDDNWLDTDSDGDGVSDSAEGTDDLDGDGVPNYLDPDSSPRDTDMDGVRDDVECPGGVTPCPDTDMDGTPDFQDTDDDGDGILTSDELPLGDTDMDGTPNYLDPDDDGDGVPTLDERPMGADQDTDMDGMPNHLDPDDDGDSIPTAVEVTDGGVFGDDVDMDGQNNWLDTDSDGDGASDTDEGTADTNGNGIPAYLDPTETGMGGDGGVDGGTDGGVDGGTDGGADGGGADGGDTDGGTDTDGGFPAGGTVAGGALCSASDLHGGAELSWLALVLLALAFVGRRRRARGARRGHVALVALAILLSLATTAKAQVELDRFRPSEVATEGFSTSGARDLGHLRYSLGLHLDYANDPLVFEAVAGDRDSESAQLVAHHLVAHVGGAVGLFDRVVVYGGLPVNLVQSGDTFGGSTTADGAGLGDLWLGGRVRLLGGGDEMYALAVGATLTLPFAHLIDGQESYSGDRTVRLLPEVLFDADFGPVALATNVGVRVRGESSLGNLAANDELTFGLGLSIPVLDDHSLIAHIDLSGATNLHDFGARAQTALELLAGAKYHHSSGLVAGLAAGPGLTRGYGSPDVRVIGMIGYATPAAAPVEAPPAPPADTDGDGILDPDDRCPAQPEDADSFEDEDGCPDPDNDHDQVLDQDDQCPLEPEDREGFEDEDGCPDPDNDSDTVLDQDDQCPNEAEDRDGFDDEDGCPDPDNDSDTVLDQDDQCPQTPGSPESDGCPAEARVDRATGSIVILQRVEFATNRDVILDRSMPVMQAVQSILSSNPQILRVRVEGHTDDRGRDRANMDLSRRRASSVKRWLSEHGIDGGRLDAFGCGEDYPIETNRTRAGRQNNRRVEFRITDPAPEQEAPDRQNCQPAD